MGGTLQVTARALALLAAIGMLQGCASIGSVQSADTLGEGNFQIGVEPGLHVGALVGTAVQAPPTIWPHGDVAFRYGVSDRIDLGARAGSSIIEAQSKFLLTTPGSGFKLSLAPAAGFFVATEIGTAPAFSAAFPVLLGFDLHPRFELVVGPRVQLAVMSLPAELAVQVGVGSSVGVVMQLHRLFALMPEIAFSVPAVLSGSNSGAFGGAGVFQFQFKVGVLIGPSRRGNALPVTPDAPEPESESPPPPDRQTAPPSPPTPPSNVPLPPAPPPPPE